MEWEVLFGQRCKETKNAIIYCTTYGLIKLPTFEDRNTVYFTRDFLQWVGYDYDAFQDMIHFQLFPERLIECLRHATDMPILTDTRQPGLDIYVNKDKQMYWKLMDYYGIVCDDSTPQEVLLDLMETRTAEDVYDLKMGGVWVARSEYYLLKRTFNW